MLAKPLIKDIYFLLERKVYDMVWSEATFHISYIWSKTGFIINKEHIRTRSVMTEMRKESESIGDAW